MSTCAGIAAVLTVGCKLNFALFSVSGKKKKSVPFFTVCSDSSFGIATRYGLDGPGIESRWGARFSAPAPTGPGAHPASYTMGTVSLSRGYSGRGVAFTTHLI